MDPCSQQGDGTTVMIIRRVSNKLIVQCCIELFK